MKYKYSRKNIARSIQRCSSLQIADFIKKMVIKNLLATKPEKVPEPTVFKPWRKFLKDEAISVKVKVTPSKKSDKRKAKLLEEYLNTKFEDNILVKHLSTDRGGSRRINNSQSCEEAPKSAHSPDEISDTTRQGADSPTAKVRPLQEFIQTETTYGITTVKVLNDFWNWSKEVTNSINEIIDHLNSMEEGK